MVKKLSRNCSYFQVVLQNLEREKYANIIQQELEKLSEDFGRYRNRWDNLKKHIDTVQKDVKEIHISTKKISNSFEKISKVEFEEKENKELAVIDR